MRQPVAAQDQEMSPRLTAWGCGLIEQCSRSLKETPMMVKVKEVVIEQAQALADQAERLRKMPVEAARGAAARSADTVKSMRDPVRALTRSGVKLTAVSQSTLQRLIELQEQIITSAMSDAAGQLERAAGATSVSELARIQGKVLLAARERIVKDMAQAMAILKEAGTELGKVAAESGSTARRKVGKKAPAKKAIRKAPAKKKAKRGKPAHKK